MSHRYEMVHAARLRARVAAPGHDFGHGDVFDTPALVLGAGESSLVVVGSRPELLAALELIRDELVGDQSDADAPAGQVPEPRTEIVVDRDPDLGTHVRVWREGTEVTDDPQTVIVIIDPGAGHSRADWDDDSDLEPLCEEARSAARELKDGYADSEYIGN